MELLKPRILQGKKWAHLYRVEYDLCPGTGMIIVVWYNRLLFGLQRGNISIRRTRMTPD